MKELIRIVAFGLVVAAGARAGIMQNDKAAPSPTPAPATSAAQIETEPTAEEVTQIDLVAAAQEIALSLLENLLTLY